jgi:hypothetical protein
MQNKKQCAPSRPTGNSYDRPPSTCSSKAGELSHWSTRRLASCAQNHGKALEYFKPSQPPSWSNVATEVVTPFHPLVALHHLWMTHKSCWVMPNLLLLLLLLLLLVSGCTVILVWWVCLFKCYRSTWQFCYHGCGIHECHGPPLIHVDSS